MAKMKRTLALWLSTTILLSGCSTIENRYIGLQGKYGTGQTSMGVAMDNGHFSIADDKGSCSGTFGSWQAYTIVFPVTCSDGKKGAVTMTRPTATGVAVLAGEGRIDFPGGETRRFAFGPASNI